jgi:hypothetical protein
MTMYLSNYLEDKTLRAFLGATVQAPANVYAALFLSDPGDAGTGTEIAYAGYTRMPIEFSVPAIGAGMASIANTADIAFPKSDRATNDITHLGLYDSAVGGNLLASMVLDEPLQVAAGVAPLIQAKEWVYESSGNFSNGFKAKYLNILRGVNLQGFEPHLAMFDGNPDQGGAELVGTSYARTPIAFGAPAEQPSGQSTISNLAFVSSARSAENWGNLTQLAIMDSAEGGEVVAFKAYGPMSMGRGKAVFMEPGDYSIGIH